MRVRVRVKLGLGLALGLGLWLGVRAGVSPRATPAACAPWAIHIRAMLTMAIVLTTARPTCSMCALGYTHYGYTHYGYTHYGTCSMCALGCGAPRWMLCGGGRQGLVLG